MRARAAVKEIAYGLADAAGLPRLGRRARRDGLTILTYHSFGPAAEHPYLHRMPVARLKGQLDHLRQHYEIVALEAGLDRLQDASAKAPERPMVAITVDDGYGDNFEYLFPAVREAGVPVTILLATEYLDRGFLPWPTRISALLHFATATEVAAPLRLRLATSAQRIEAGRALRGHLSHLGYAARAEALSALERDLKPRAYTRLRPLTWDQVREMRDAGVQFGAHTHYHGWLDRLNVTEIRYELAFPRWRIEHEMGMPCRILAYPNGNWNEDVVAAAMRAGYIYALTQDTGVNRREGLKPRALSRIEVPYNERIGTFACRVGGVAL